MYVLPRLPVLRLTLLLLLLLPTEHRPHADATVRLDHFDILALSVGGMLSNHEGPVHTKKNGTPS